jgi:hypothetical protein
MISHCTGRTHTRTAYVLKETADMKSSEVAFRRIGSADELLNPENSTKPPWCWTKQMMTI